jgi:superfamily I DNA/RNA helicase
VDQTVTLRFHYRSGRKICQLADAVGETFNSGYELILPTSNYREGDLPSTVDVFQGSIADQGAEIVRRLSVQRRAYPESFFGVICPRLSDLRDIADILEGAGLDSEMCVQTRDDGYQPIDPGRPIWLSTIHSAKGLEFRTLHIAALEHAKSFRGAQKRLVYTAVTRAKTALSLYHSAPLPAYLRGALARTGPVVAPPDISAAFGRR